MRIALCLSGQPRFYNAAETYGTIKEKILDVYQCDVFMHLWWEPGLTHYDCAPWASASEKVITPEGDIPSDLQRLYRPKKMLVEAPLPKSIVKRTYERTSSPATPYNLHSMYTSLKKSYELCDKYCAENSEVKYDFIIRCRFDAQILHFPPLRLLFSHCVNAVQKPVVYYSNWGDNASRRRLANNFFIVYVPLKMSGTGDWRGVEIPFSLIDRIDELTDGGSNGGSDGGVVLNDEEITYQVMAMASSDRGVCRVDLISQDLFDVEIWRGN